MATGETTAGQLYSNVP